MYSHAAAAAAKSLQSCLTLCDSRDNSPPGSPVPGILQARTLKWVVIFYWLKLNRLKTPNVGESPHTWLMGVQTGTIPILKHLMILGGCHGGRHGNPL